MASPDIYNYVPKYISQEVDADPQETITSTRWDELWNLVIEQGDWNAETLAALTAEPRIIASATEPTNTDVLWFDTSS